MQSPLKAPLRDLAHRAEVTGAEATDRIVPVGERPIGGGKGAKGGPCSQIGGSLEIVIHAGLGRDRQEQRSIGNGAGKIRRLWAKGGGKCLSEIVALDKVSAIARDSRRVSQS